MGSPEWTCALTRVNDNGPTAKKMLHGRDRHARAAGTHFAIRLGVHVTHSEVWRNPVYRHHSHGAYRRQYCRWWESQSRPNSRTESCYTSCPAERTSATPDY